MSETCAKVQVALELGRMRHAAASPLRIPYTAHAWESDPGNHARFTFASGKGTGLLHSRVRLVSFRRRRVTFLHACCTVVIYGCVSSETLALYRGSGGAVAVERDRHCAVLSRKRRARVRAFWNYCRAHLRFDIAEGMVYS